MWKLAQATGERIEMEEAALRAKQMAGANPSQPKAPRVPTTFEVWAWRIVLVAASAFFVGPTLLDPEPRGQFAVALFIVLIALGS
jgi:hypothetical protein